MMVYLIVKKHLMYKFTIQNIKYKKIKKRCGRPKINYKMSLRNL